MKKKIVALCIVASFLCLQSVVQTFAGVSDIKKKMDQQNTDKPSTSQSASGPAPANSPTDSFDEVLKKAEAGDAKAQDRIGFKYDKGNGVAQDKKKAVEWYTKAAEQGNASAQMSLGFKYSKGEGVAQDKKKAVELFSKAAGSNSIYSCLLGDMYFKGEEVTQDKKKALEWYTKSAEQEILISDAPYALGVMYYDGDGVPQDKKKAFEWFVKAADAFAGEEAYRHAYNEMTSNFSQDKPNYKQVYVQKHLGWMYDEGEGVTQNKKKAVEWYNKAAEQGDAGAQFLLGYMYFKGEGIKMNKIEAHNWWVKAAKQGDEGAQKKLDILAPRCFKWVT